MINTLKNNPLTGRQNVKDNLTKNERIALKQLKSDNAIIIKEADKGNAVVIMDRDFYKEIFLDMLSNSEFYEKNRR